MKSLFNDLQRKRGISKTSWKIDPFERSERLVSAVETQITVETMEKY